jgi:hypothetical protein
LLRITAAKAVLKIAIARTKTSGDKHTLKIVAQAQAGAGAVVAAAQEAMRVSVHGGRGSVSGRGSISTRMATGTAQVMRIIHIRSYAHTLIHSYTHTLIHSYTHTLIHSYTHTLIHCYAHLV